MHTVEPRVVYLLCSADINCIRARGGSHVHSYCVGFFLMPASMAPAETLAPPLCSEVHSGNVAALHSHSLTSTESLTGASGAAQGRCQGVMLPQHHMRIYSERCRLRLMAPRVCMNRSHCSLA
jgi:hypothetical protein